ncbi:MAG: OB-fold nucleic acid binding domain-containing protein, partial [Syntrophomonadaceae bacterium]|nr:OB-fold nucleic acid binding domain-containing protein [Syntrophomonadaceae bacterium]
MQKVTVTELLYDINKFEGKSVMVNGWVRLHRDQKTFGFIMLNDGTHFNSLQILYEKDNLKDLALASLRTGAAISVTGLVINTPEGKQPLEIQATQIDLIGDCPADYPIQPKRHTREFLREVAHLRPRTNLFSAVFRVRSLAAFAVHQFFQQQGFIYVHTPIITASDAEGAGEMFRVTTLNALKPPLNDDGTVDFSQDFFSSKTNLTVSGQLEAEAFALAFNKVYTFGPTFRAENSNTARHAAEFWMIEPEIVFAGLKEDMDLAEAMVKYVI